MKTKNNEFLYLSDKLDILDERLDSMENILIKQEENLKEHMKRTQLLEDSVAPLNKFMWGAVGIGAFITMLAAIYAAVH